MIHTEVLEHACKLAVLSPFIKNERGVSLILLAPYEHGKSEILKKFSFISSVKVSTDFNSFHFAEYATEYQMGLKRTLIFPDFLRIVKRKYSVQANILGILNSITEEGWIGKLPLGQVVNQPIHANVLTALTKSEILDKRYKWTRIGFLSRFLPLSYTYRKETSKLIRNYIKDRVYRKDEPYNFDVPKTEIDIILPNEIASKIERITLNIAKEENFLGFRLQRQLQTLAMANALANNRNIVTKDDYEAVKMISSFVNYKFNPI